MKPTLKIVWDPRSKDNKRALRLRVTYKRSPRIYSLGSKMRITKDEFLKKDTDDAKTAFLETEDIFKQAEKIAYRLGHNFTFKEFSKEYRKILNGETSGQDVQTIHVKVDHFSTGVVREVKFKAITIDVFDSDYFNKCFRMACIWEHIFDYFLEQGFRFNGIPVMNKFCEDFWNRGFEFTFMGNNNPEFPWKWKHREGTHVFNEKEMFDLIMKYTYGKSGREKESRNI